MFIVKRKILLSIQENVKRFLFKLQFVRKITIKIGSIRTNLIFHSRDSKRNFLYF